MKHHTDTDASNLEAEYIRMKATLYKNFFRYCTVVVLIVIIKEAFRAILYSRFGSLVMISVVLIFGGSSIYFIWRQKENQELSITICLALLFIFGLMTQYHSNSGYFDVPLETFNVAYAYAAFERIVLSRISKFSHRACFLLCTTSVRALTIRTSSIALLIMQFVYMSFTIYLDYDREKYDKRFFTTYFKNKEQLLKFKNLVVQDIPESIIIISQNLTKPLFVNNSFEQLIEDNTTKSIHARLKEFLIQDSLDVSQASSQGSSASLPARRQTLLRFLESTVLQINRSPENQKFSCNLTYKKNLSENIEGEDERNQEYMFEAKVVHLLWDEEPAIAVILHDITQQHTILSLKIADAHKDTILATVSHELRTPLNGIMGMVQIIQKKVKDTEILNYLNICKNSGDLLLSLVNSILDLNQIRAKKLKLSLETVKLSELLENIIRLFEFQCQHKGLNLKLKMTPNCPEYITTDKNRLSQIFINLVGNALKFTQNGSITISVSEAYNSEELAFMVEDTGSGIKDEDKKKLFKVFGKLEQSDNNVNPHGVGLGLTISDKLARLLGSDGIDLESEYGKGSRFIFVIKKNLKNSNESGDQEIDTQRQISDEQGDVHNKMLNYSTEYVKTSQQSMFPDHSMRTLIDISNSSTRKSSLSFTAKIRSLEFNPNQIKKDSNSSITPCTLIVDDNPLNAIIAETLVNSHGYKAKTALYGQVAIDIILNTNFNVEPIQLVFMDCQMPVMDGFTVTKILKKMMLEKKIPEIPIVALTANDSEADREASRRAGMCEHMTKPLKESELGRILNKYMTK